MKLVFIHENVEKETKLLEAFNDECILQKMSEQPSVDDIFRNFGSQDISHLAFVYHNPGFCTIPFSFKQEINYDKNCGSCGNNNANEIKETKINDIKDIKDNIENNNENDLKLNKPLLVEKHEGGGIQNNKEFNYFNDSFISVLKHFKSNNENLIVDILTCSLNKTDFAEEVRKLENRLNIDIRYSLNQTGNNPNGDWVLESDNVDIKKEYFTEKISNWTGVLEGFINTTISLDTIKEGNIWASAGETIIEKTPNGTSGGFLYKLKRNIQWNKILLADGVNINANNHFISLGANDIFDGQDFTIDLIGTSTFGLFSMNNIANYSEAPIIRKLKVINGSLTDDTVNNVNGGYIVRPNQRFFIVEDCSSTGDIVRLGGGICGINAGLDGECLIKNCYSTGNQIGIDAGGICGNSAGFRGICRVINCYSFGNINQYGGGICGSRAGASDDVNSPGYCEIQNCYSSGNQISDRSGGICGATSSTVKSKVRINKCYSSGQINTNGGGICGYSGYYYDTLITNCLSSGNQIGNGAGGICGRSAGSNGDITIQNCYSTGSIITSGGGICGQLAGISGFCSIQNCYSTGSIGSNGGGICGQQAGDSGFCSVQNCYSTGSIGSYGGGICGPYASINYNNSARTCTTECTANNALCLIQNCYSIGNINSNGGGICGSETGSYFSDKLGTSNCVILNCYSAGIFTSGSINNGSILGSGVSTGANTTTLANNSKVYIINCYGNGSSIGSYFGSNVYVNSLTTAIPANLTTTASTSNIPTLSLTTITNQINKTSQINTGTITIPTPNTLPTGLTISLNQWNTTNIWTSGSATTSPYPFLIPFSEEPWYFYSKHNDTPTLTSVKYPTIINRTSSLIPIFDSSISDTDKQNFTYELVINPLDLEINSTTGIISTQNLQINNYNNIGLVQIIVDENDEQQDIYVPVVLDVRPRPPVFITNLTYTKNQYDTLNLQLYNTTLGDAPTSSTIIGTLPVGIVNNNGILTGTFFQFGENINFEVSMTNNNKDNITVARTITFNVKNVEVPLLQFNNLNNFTSGEPNNVPSVNNFYTNYNAVQNNVDGWSTFKLSMDLTLELTDTYGDGWDGSLIKIEESNNNINWTITKPSIGSNFIGGLGPIIVTHEVKNLYYRLVVENIGNYPEEKRITIKNGSTILYVTPNDFILPANNSVIYSGINIPINTLNIQLPFNITYNTNLSTSKIANYINISDYGFIQLSVNNSTIADTTNNTTNDTFNILHNSISRITSYKIVNRSDLKYVIINWDSTTIKARLYIYSNGIFDVIIKSSGSGNYKLGYVNSNVPNLPAEINGNTLKTDNISGKIFRLNMSGTVSPKIGYYLYDDKDKNIYSFLIPGLIDVNNNIALPIVLGSGSLSNYDFEIGNKINIQNNNIYIYIKDINKFNKIDLTTSDFSLTELENKLTKTGNFIDDTVENADILSAIMGNSANSYNAYRRISELSLLNTTLTNPSNANNKYLELMGINNPSSVIKNSRTQNNTNNVLSFNNKVYYLAPGLVDKITNPSTLPKLTLQQTADVTVIPPITPNDLTQKEFLVTSNVTTYPLSKLNNQGIAIKYFTQTNVIINDTTPNSLNNYTISLTDLLNIYTSSLTSAPTVNIKYQIGETVNLNTSADSAIESKTGEITLTRYLLTPIALNALSANAASRNSLPQTNSNGVTITYLKNNSGTYEVLTYAQAQDEYFGVGTNYKNKGNYIVYYYIPKFTLGPDGQAYDNLGELISPSTFTLTITLLTPTLATLNISIASLGESLPSVNSQGVAIIWQNESRQDITYNDANILYLQNDITVTAYYRIAKFNVGSNGLAYDELASSTVTINRVNQITVSTNLLNNLGADGICFEIKSNTSSEYMLGKILTVFGTNSQQIIKIWYLQGQVRTSFGNLLNAVPNINGQFVDGSRTWTLLKQYSNYPTITNTNTNNTNLTTLDLSDTTSVFLGNTVYTIVIAANSIRYSILGTQQAIYKNGNFTIDVTRGRGGSTGFINPRGFIGSVQFLNPSAKPLDNFELKSRLQDSTSTLPINNPDGIPVKYVRPSGSSYSDLTNSEANDYYLGAIGSYKIPGTYTVYYYLNGLGSLQSPKEVTMNLYAENNSTVKIGNGTTSNPTTVYPAPYGNYWWGAKHQFFITANEISAAGILPNSLISNIGFNIKNKNTASEHNNFKVTLYTTTNTDPIGTSYWIQNKVADTNPENYQLDIGVSQHTFNTPWIWNGTDNIVVETCFNNIRYTQNASTEWTENLTGTSIKSRWYNADSEGVCAIADSSTTSNTIRPNIIFSAYKKIYSIDNIPNITRNANEKSLPTKASIFDITYYKLESGVYTSFNTYQEAIDYYFGSSGTFKNPGTYNVYYYYTNSTTQVPISFTLTITLLTPTPLTTLNIGQLSQGGRLPSVNSQGFPIIWQNIAGEDITLDNANTLYLSTPDTVTAKYRIAKFGLGSDGMAYDEIPSSSVSISVNVISERFVIFGTGTNSQLSAGLTPYSTYYHDAKTQYIISPDELSSQNIISGSLIKSIGFKTTTKNARAMIGFTVKAWLSSTTSFTSSALNYISESSTISSVTYTSITAPDVGTWAEYVFETPISWDGNSSIIIQTCFDNTAYSNNSGVEATEHTTIKVCGRASDNVSGCQIQTPSSSSKTRPNIRIKFI